MMVDSVLVRNALGEDARGGRVDARQQHRELLAAVAGRQVTAAHAGAQHLGGTDCEAPMPTPHHDGIVL